MAGSWEIRESNKVLVGILHVDNVTIAWSFGLRNLIVPGRILPVSGMPYDMARNVVNQTALDSGAQFAFHLDSDVIPPRDAILRLMSYNLPIVSGVYHRRSPPHGLPVMIRNGGWVQQYPENTLIEVDYVGAGCLLLRRDLLEACPPICPEQGKRWFHWKVDQSALLKPGEALSEDFAFCAHIKKTMGIKTMVDTGVQCRHVGLAQAGYGTFSPCEAVPVT